MAYMIQYIFSVLDKKSEEILTHHMILMPNDILYLYNFPTVHHHYMSSLEIDKIMDTSLYSPSMLSHYFREPQSDH